MKSSPILIVLILLIIANLVWLNYQMAHNGTTPAQQLTTAQEVNPAAGVADSRADSLRVKSMAEQAIAHEQQGSGQALAVSRENAITRAVAKIEPAVVSVNVIKTKVVRRYTNPFDNPFFGFFEQRPYYQQVKGIGTGIIVDTKGYIITNTHVVEGATQIMVVLADSRQFEAKIIDFDSVADIAVLKIDAPNLPVAILGTSRDLMIGESCIAVGNPYGYLMKDSKPSVSVGVISAVDRNFAENEQGKIYKKMIQTDAAINPGNSGGPLVNIRGEVIGINTFIFSENGGSVGIGFAIPIDRVGKVAKEVITHGKIRDIWLGFKVQDLNLMLGRSLNLANLDGVIVTWVDEQGPAAAGGLTRGDIITRIGDTTIRNSNDAEMAVSDLAVGDSISLAILRAGQKQYATITAQEK